MDLKQILPFPLEPAPTLGLFSNYSTVSIVCLSCPTPLNPLTPNPPLCSSSKPTSFSLPVTPLCSSCLVTGWQKHCWLSDAILTVMKTDCVLSFLCYPDTALFHSSFGEVLSHTENKEA